MPSRTASTSSRGVRKAPPRTASRSAPGASRKRASNADRVSHGKSRDKSRSKATHPASARGDSDDAPAARRAIWKGAISFGLLHVPVALYPASRDQRVDFDWLDKRTMDPVGYKRINKRTGKDIDKTHVVKGVKQENGDYVLVSDDEIRKAYPTTTQTIEIETFVPATQVSFVYLEKPYYLEPVGKSGKVYALLREAMADAGLIAIARLVIHSKEHLAALLPAGPALMIGMLRWANEIRPCDDLNLPAEGKSAHGFKAAELQMARQLIDEMSNDWHPEDYHDEFTAAIRGLIARKVEEGETQTVTPLEAAPEDAGEGGNVVDLTELLRRSLGGKSKKKAA
ncbi:Ku protein [Roseateles chitinivorans]|uniref:non-homologous end joining protein Ku n=1 Tax=Roseateles chitinivorans TaxID=2917965 RepID=UPI003D67E33B